MIISAGRAGCAVPRSAQAVSGTQPGRDWSRLFRWVGVGWFLASLPLVVAAATPPRTPAATNPPPATALVRPPAQATASTNLAAGGASGEELTAIEQRALLLASTMGGLDDKQKLGVGDSVTFRVIEDREPPKSLTVTDAGELDVPELGLVPAANRTCKELAFEIKQKLEQTTYYSATVVLGIEALNKTISGRKVYVVGQVRETGPQEIPAGEAWTVSKAIMTAGGFTDFADKKKVRLVRGGARGKTYTINVIDIWEKGKTESDLNVEPEDLIYVPARAVNFY